MNMLLTENIKMSYDRIILICPSIDEENYQFLKKQCDEIQDNFEKDEKIRLGYRVFQHISKPEDFIKVEEIDKSLQHIVIIDDFMKNKSINALVENFATVCRKYNCSLIYLSQAYFEVPKTLRLQMANGYIALWCPPSLKEIGQYMQEFGLGQSKEDFIEMFNRATKHDNGARSYLPLLIDFKNRGTKFQFRRGIDTPLWKEEFTETSGSDDEKKMITKLK